MTLVRPARAEDLPEWVRMRCLLWPEHDPRFHEADAREWLRQPDAVVLVAERVDGGLAGFAEVGTRKYAEGCETSPVAFLEGWFVDADLRRVGVGTALVHAAEAWARAHGLREFASDALLDNTVSHQAHEAVGFREVERLVTFMKPL